LLGPTGQSGFKLTDLSEFGVALSRIVTFPDDENGDVLRNMQRDGDDLSQARNIDFQHIFPSRESALAFAAAAVNDTDIVSISWYEHARCWNVQVTRHMVPDHGAITALEIALQSIAREHGGDSDGWGCFDVRKQRDS
jgi:Regulator of ribonuclease activity B